MTWPLALQRLKTEDDVSAYLDRHVARCKKGCKRDAQGWLQYGEMCSVGQRIVRKLVELP